MMRPSQLRQKNLLRNLPVAYGQLHVHKHVFMHWEMKEEEKKKKKKKRENIGDIRAFSSRDVDVLV